MLGLALAVFWGDVMSTRLDPKAPFQTYSPPPAPDYGMASAWEVRGAGSDALPADVFFVGPTTYDGGEHWNAPLDDPTSRRLFREVVAPNYIGPFVSVGRVYAPKYRHASLYTQLTLREDAREARQFAYGDVREAFRTFLQSRGRDRPFLILGVEQGGTLAARLLAEEVAPNPNVARRLVAAYLIGAVVPADAPPIPPCAARFQYGCVAAWARGFEGDIDSARRLLDRALVWNDRGELVNLKPRPALCFNPILGAASDAPAPARMHLGAANATGLEWGARPAFMARQVAAQCRNGVLAISRPKSPSLRPTGGWADRRKAAAFNLFYADEEADAQRRLNAWLAAARQPGA